MKRVSMRFLSVLDLRLRPVNSPQTAVRAAIGSRGKSEGI
jgi:hypothetical protein